MTSVEATTECEALLDAVPVPLWIRARADGRMLAVNTTALHRYGYARAEFLALGPGDLDASPDPDGPGRPRPGMAGDRGRAQHRRSDGRTLEVELDSQDIDFAGEPARLVVAADISDHVRGERRLRRQHARLRQVFADAADGLVVIDAEGRVRLSNAAAARLFSRSSGQLEGQLLPELTRHPVGGPIVLERAGMAPLQVEARVAATEWNGGEALVYALRDISRGREGSSQQVLMAEALDACPYGVLICDGRTSGLPIVYANAAFESLSGYPLQALRGRNPRVLQGSDEAQPELDDVREALRLERECTAVLRNTRADGTQIRVELRLAPLRDRDGALTHWVGAYKDVTAERRAEVELSGDRSEDPVTGLSRFSAQEEVLSALVMDAMESGARVAVFYIDIDRFSAVNETMGHSTGDQALRLIADRLRQQLHNLGRVSRIASDEFVAFISYQPGEFDPVSFANQVRLRMEAPLAVLPYSLFMTCTIGIAEFPENATTGTDLVRCAETAVNRAKRSGRNQVRAFTPEDAQQQRERMQLAARLRESIAKGELQVHYQPQVNTQDGRVAGFEALLRWQTEDFGLLSSNRFIAVAEELGLIVSLGRWIQDEVCAQLARWLAAGHDDIFVSLNMSMQQLLRPTFLLEFKESLRVRGVPARMIEIELTETSHDDDLGKLQDVLTELRGLGTRVALDDFGAGNASLEHLKRLPVDKLKIAREFIADISTESSDAAIARAVLAMGHQLRLQVLAQGVENQAQLGFLRRNHFDQFQGYLFSHPVDADGAALLLRQRYLSPEFFSQTRPGQVLLLVDDEENVLRSLTRLFRRDGYTILSTTRVDQAFDLLAKNAVQVIVSDQRMPGASGTEFLGRVKELYPDTIRMILSGYTDLATVTQSINRGAIYRFLTKPWNDEELREHIRGAFRAYANQQRPNRNT